jgi:hypothetical protein
MSSICAVELSSNVTDSNYNFERIEKAGTGENKLALINQKEAWLFTIIKVHIRVEPTGKPACEATYIS